MNVIERAILRRYAMNWLKAHWPAITALMGGALTVIIPGLQAIAAANPKTTVGVLCSAIIAAYYAESPRQPKPAPVTPIKEK